MSYYEKGSNACVSVMTCPPDMNCNRCEMREYYGSNAPTMPMHCTECAPNHRMMAGRCIRNDAPEVPCVLPAVAGTPATTPPHLEGCKKCYNTRQVPANSNTNT